MPEGFVTFAALLGTADANVPIAPRSVAGEVADAAPSAVPSHAGFVADCGRLRLAALAAYERGVEDLLAAVARDVLGRELLLAPADITAIADRALAAFRAYEPVGLALSEHDARAIETSLPVRVDRTLARGDVIVEVRDGAFESPISLRLDVSKDVALERALEVR